jgi:hypothetical protein
MQLNRNRGWADEYTATHVGITIIVDQHVALCGSLFQLRVVVTF